MDPAAALLRAIRLIASEQWLDAQDAISDYITWRAKGGFEPRWSCQSNHLAEITGDTLKGVLLDAICNGLRNRTRHRGLNHE